MRSRWHYKPTIDDGAAPPASGGTVAAGPVAPATDAKPLDPRWQQLMDLIARLPAEKAEKLRLLLAGDTLVTANPAGIGRVLQALELRRGDIEKAEAEPLMRKICVLLEPFLVNDDDGTAGTIRRKALVPWWEASMAQSAALRGIDKRYQEAVQAKQAGEIERLEDEAMAELARRARGLVLKNSAQAVIEDVHRIGAVLGGGRAFAKALETLGVSGPPCQPGIEVDDGIIHDFGKAYAALGEEPAFDPVWLGHAVMNHLDKPADAALLIHRIAGSTDVQVLEHTELAPLMDRIIDHLVAVAGRTVAAIKTAASGRSPAEIKAAAELATLYFELAEGVSREIKLERASQWGQAYLNSRKALSDLVPEKLEDFTQVIEQFLDDWTLETSGQEDHPAYQAAMAAADFIGALKLRAARHGFGMPFTTLERRLQDALGRPMKRPKGAEADPWPGQKRRLLSGLRLI